MAKIQKTKSGTYEFWVDLGRDPITGKRRQVHWSGFGTKRDAETEIRRLQNEADIGISVKKQNSAITFAEIAEIWLEHDRTTSGNKLTTIDLKRQTIVTANRYIGTVKLSDFTHQRYNAFLASLSKDFGTNTLNSIHITASMVLKYAVECNLLAVNPAANAKKPKTIEDVDDDPETTYLSKAEVNAFMEAVKDYGDLQYYALFRLLAYSSMRIGEALGLEVSAPMDTWAEEK